MCARRLWKPELCLPSPGAWQGLWPRDDYTRMTAKLKNDHTGSPSGAPPIVAATVRLQAVARSGWMSQTGACQTTRLAKAEELLSALGGTEADIAPDVYNI